VGTIRLVTANVVELYGGLKNGTGGGAPGRDEVAPYVMENALQHDRRVLWQQLSGGTMQYDIDLGAARQVRALGLHGHRPLDAGGGLLSATMQYASSYPPGGGWANAGIVSLVGARDAVTVIPATQTFRYWRVDCDTVGGAFTLGKIMLGQIVDLGQNPSTQDERVRLPNVLDRTAGEDPIVTIVGDIRTQFTLRFRSITGTVLNTLRALAALGQSFILIDRDDVGWEVIVVDGEIEYELAFISGTTPLYNCDLHLEQLG
jgi:hypothetical protein